MSNQIQITSGAKVRALDGVITGTTGVLSSVPLGGANGVATLDSSGKVPLAQLPASVFEYKGTWNATTNTPYLVNGVGTSGWVYVVSVGGLHDFGAGSILFLVGDQVLYDGSIWERSSGATGTVTSVALTAPSAFNVSGSPITTSGTLAITGAGTTSQYINGAGSLTTFPSLTGFVPYTGATNDLNLGTHNLFANNLFDGFINVAASGSQIVLTIASTPSYTITGSGGQTIKLPDATTLPNGAIFSFNNNQSSGAITVNNNSNTLVVSVPSGGFAEVVLLDNSIAAGSWDRHFKAPSNVSWSTNTLDYAGSITSATWNGNVVAINRGGTGSSTQNFVDLTTTQTIGGAKTFSSSLTASSLIKTGGTSSQFLKADGSVDSSSYITLTSLSFTAGSGAYNNTTGVITIPTNNNQITNGSNFITLGSINASNPIFYSATYGTISIQVANSTQSGYLTSTDWNTFNSKGSGTVTSVAMSVPTGLSISGSPITTSGTLAVTLTTGYSIPTTSSQTNWDTAYTNRITSATAPLSITSNVISISQATTSTSGYLSSTDWNTFNGKQNTLIAADATHDGYLTSANWVTFNAKQSAITLTTTGSSGGATFVTNTLNVPTYTLAGLGGQPQLNGTGFVKASGTTISYDNSTYLTGNQTITLSGDISGSGATAITTTIGALKVTNGMLAGTINYSKMDATTVPTWNQSTTGTAANITATSNATLTTLSALSLPYSQLTGIPTLSYLPLAGGIMTGQIVIKQSSSSTDYTNGIKFPDNAFGGGGDVAGLRLYASSGENQVLEMYVGNDATDVINFATGVGGTANNNAVTINGNIIYNAANSNTITSLGTIGTGVWNGSAITDTYISSASTWNAKQNAITLTTTGTSGAATFSANTLNIPNYGSALSGYLPLTGGTLTGALSGTSAVFTVGNLSTTINANSGNWISNSLKSDLANNSTLPIINGKANSANNAYTIIYNHISDGSSSNFLGLGFYGADNLLKLNASGNLGLGVTPSAWNGIYKVTEIGTAAIFGTSSYNSAAFSTNVFYNSANSPRYIANDFSNMYWQDDGNHIWYNAPSGTAGNAITFTQAMTLTASGRLLINKTNEETYQLDVNGTGRFVGNVTGTSFIHYVNSSYNATSSIYGVSYNYGSSETSDGVTYSITGGSAATTGNFFTWKTQTGGGTPSTVFTIAKTGAATFSSSVTAVGGNMLIAPDANYSGYSAIGFGGSVANGGAKIFAANAGNDALYIAGPTGQGVTLRVNGTTEIVKFLSNGNTLLGNSGGNVGIGTSSPSYKLDISATGYGIQHYANGSNYLRTYCGSSYQIIESNGTNQFGYVGGDFFVQTSATERMRITSGGNVLIGTTTDATGKLQVNGTVYATGFYESSDIRLKTILEKNPIVDLKGIEVIKFTRNDSDINQVRYGYSAQEVQSICSDLVSGNDFLNVNYIDVHTLKIAALEQEIKELKTLLNEK